MTNITNFYDYSTILVCYSAGTGGNHISNLISTSNNVAPRFISDNYIPDLTNKYLNADPAKNGVHFGCFISNVAEFPNLLSTIETSTLPYVIQGHIVEVYHKIDIFKKQGKIKLVVLEWSPNTIVDRILPKKFNNISEIKFLYNKEAICKLFEIDKDDVIPISVDDIFKNNIYDIINTLSYSLGIQLNLELCDSLHKIWIDRFIK